MATPEKLVIESMFRIADKDGIDCDFHLNTAQVKLDNALTGRDIIPKPRQEGISSYYLARNLAKCLIHRNHRAVVISHDEKSTERMLTKVHYMIENMKGAKPVLGRSSTGMITFPKVGSSYYIGTAGQKKFGRGDTINSLHCSEVAYWDNADILMTGLLNAVPIEKGEVSMESTGNGKGNYYHKACQRAYQGIGRYQLHFLSWLDFPEYDLNMDADESVSILNSLDEELDEINLVKNVKLTPGQIKFRRIRLEELNYDTIRFKQEYPMFFDECFQSTGHSIFTYYNYVPTDEWVRQGDRNIWAIDSIYDNPYSKYIMGVDVSGGVGKDDSVLDIYDLVSMEQVCQFSSDRLDPTRLGEKIIELAKHFNDAFVICESNNHGIATLAYLKKNYKRSLIYRDRIDSDNIVRFGYRTTSKNKPLLINELRVDIQKDIVIHSPLTVDQLDTFIETDTGKLEANKGAKDDAVIAAALANIGRNRAIIMTGIQGAKRKDELSFSADPMLIDGAIENILNRKKNKKSNVLEFYYPRQVV